MISSGAFLAPVSAQLQIVEVMYNPLDPDAWEWIELRNTDPNNAIDLNGSYLHSLDLPRILASDPPHIDSSSPGGTIVPADGVAVLYNAESSGVDPNDDNRALRDAWGTVDPNSRLIAVKDFPTLPNHGGSVGIWPSMASYETDLVNGGQFVGSFENAAVGLDFRLAFPNPVSGKSIYWNGNGDFTNGVNWTASVSGSTGAVASIEASSGSGTVLNSTDDLGSPGVLPPSAAPNGSFLITEVMFDPASDEPAWEWIEVLNSTGSDIDFSSTSYILDDNEGLLNLENITQGILKDNQIAIFYNADELTEQNMLDAWGDPNGVTVDPNERVFIGVTDFPELNDVDHIGIWANMSTYNLDWQGAFRTFGEALIHLEYGGGFWPSPLDAPSIYLTDLSSDPNSVFNWDTSDENDAISFLAKQATSGGTVIHAGGDVGSPGLFDPNALPNDADFDDDSLVTGTDFLAWQRGVDVGNSHSEGDTNQDGTVDEADLAVWTSLYPRESADLNGDQVVDARDFLAWQRGEGDLDLELWQSYYENPSAIASSVAAVPEPATLLGSLTLLLLVFHSRNRLFYYHI